VINLLIEIVAKGGSLVLGVGPTPEGLIQPEAVERLQAIGKWMRQNGKAIYNTRSVKNYHDGNVWFTGNKDGRTVYAFYMLSEGEKLPAQVSWTGNLPSKKGSIRLVSNGKKLSYKVKDGQVTVTLPKGLPAQSVAMEIK
jgi:alpha-L-fucosidase